MKLNRFAAPFVAGLALAAVFLATGPNVSAQGPSVKNYFEAAQAGGDNPLNLTGTWRIGATAVTASAAELNAVVGLDTVELGLLNGATAGSITASKIVSRDAGSRIPFLTAAPAAAGTNAGTATAITADVNLVTAADGTKGVILPVAVAGMRIEIVNTVSTATALLKVYPDTGGAINGGSANAAFSVAPGQRAIFVATAALTWSVAPNDALFFSTGVASGYKTARGETALDGSNPTDIATGLTTIVSCTATIKSTSAPALGTSVITYGTASATLSLYGWKVTGAGDATLIDSTGTETIGWVCIGT